MSGPVKRARWAVALVFAVHGAVAGSFATRIPWLADRLHAGTGSLGVALLFPALGSMLTMSFAGWLTHRFGSRTVVGGLIAAWSAALVLPALAPNVPVLCALLFVYGAAAGMSDVAMNAQAVVVEQRYPRPIMSGLHGMWSAGGLVAAGVGALAAHAGLDARIHFGIVAVVLLVAGVAASTVLLDARPPADSDAPAFALPSGPILLIGLVGFCAIFAEGSAADWCAVYLRKVTHAEPGLAASAYGAFAFTMAAARLSGDSVVHRFGAVRTTRLGGITAVAGALLVAVARTPLLAALGFGLIGLGVAVVVPLTFTAAGNAPGVHPGQAIAAVATLAYGAGLAAPGVIGGIANATSLSVSFAVVAGITSVVALGASALRPRQAKPVVLS